MAGPPKTSPRCRSLGFGIKLILCGWVLVTAAVLTGGMLAIHRINARYVDSVDRSHALARATDGMLIALLNQEVGLRAYLATGERRFLEPVMLGLEQERLHDGVLRAYDQELADDGLASALQALATAIERWHREIAEPQSRARDKGDLDDLPSKLLDGKQRFDEVRGAHQRLLADLDTAMKRALLDKETQLSQLRTLLFGLGVLVLVIAAATTHSLVRRITGFAGKRPGPLQDC